MAETAAFFNEFLPAKLNNESDLLEMDIIFQFDIEGAGTWSLTLKEGGGVVEGPNEDADCVITCAQEDWEAMLDNPSMGMMLFMQGKLKASNLGLATKLQQILG